MTTKNQRRITHTRIIVDEGRKESPPLLGRPTLSNLGMILIDETGGSAEASKPETKTVNKIASSNKKMGDILKLDRLRVLENSSEIGKTSKSYPQ